MDTPKNKQFKPQSLRALLSLALVLVALGGGALFYFGLEHVRAYSVDANNRLKDADASDLQISQLQDLRNELSQSGTLIEKADRLFITSGAYQGQALTDVRNYANQAGIAIESTGFSGPAEGGTYSIDLRLVQPTSYQRLIQFLTLVEGNIPKMQVASIDLKRVEGGNSDSIEVGDIKINISVRD